MFELRQPPLMLETATHPAKFALKVLTAPLRYVRPFLYHLFPLLVCLLCIPLLMLFSAAAGWVVWRNVPVGWTVDAYLQYGDAINPYANSVLPPLLKHQPYDISLHLVVPATEANFALGNFMATLKLTTAYNESMATVSRSTVLVPPNTSVLKQFLLGSPSTTKIDMLLLSQFVPGTSPVNARLELGRTDAWKGVGNGQGRELSVLEATLKGTVRPTGIRIILARYPRFTTFISTFIFFFISLTIVFVFLLSAIRPGATEEYPLSPSNSGGGSDTGGGDDPAGHHPDEAQQFFRRHFHRRDSDSESSAPNDEKPSDQNGLRLSGLRKRHIPENLDSSQRRSQVKFEFDDGPSTLDTPPIYFRSPSPQSPPAASGTGLSQQSATTDPLSDLKTDAES